MEEQTIKLLEECSKGCKMGTDSIEQVKDYITDEDLWNVIEKYDGKYKELDKEIAGLLKEEGRPRHIQLQCCHGILVVKRPHPRQHKSSSDLSQSP